MFSEGSRIGPFLLIRRLGISSFTERWLARNDVYSMDVTVELPVGENLDRDAIRAAAKLWARTSGHPNILQFLEISEHDGQIAIVGEYVTGESLRDRMRSGVVPVDDAVRIAEGILDGTQHIHSSGVIHRNLKPENIFFNAGRPLIFNSSIASEISVVILKNSVGTVPYMAPEALRGYASTQSDIWSVGVILYELLTGNLPFPQSDLAAQFVAINEYPPAAGYIPREFAPIIEKSLAKRLEDRYGTADEMREGLRWRSQTNFSIPLESMRAAPSSYMPTPPPPMSAPPDSIHVSGAGIAGDGADRERATDSIGNLVKKIGRFFGGK